MIASICAIIFATGWCLLRSRSFTVRTINQDAARGADQRHLIHSLHDVASQSTGRVWLEGRGAVLVDADGSEYIDALSGLWNVHVGHGRRELAEAAARQMETLAYMSGYAGNSSLPAIELAERLGRLTYPNINAFYFTCGGAESNEAAFKTARFFWKAVGRPNKTKIISRRLGYHGTTLAAMSATGMDWYWPMFEPRVPGFVHIEPPYSFWFDTQGNVGQRAADMLEEAILREGADTVAAFIAEPVQGSGGVIVPPDDYFPRVREICDRHEVLLIADEVITGFGRTGRWFGLEHWGVQPDIMTFAKGITSGYVPLGGMGLSDRVADAIRAGTGKTKWMHAFTYSGHPTACAVALANIEIIEREQLVERAAAVGQRFQQRMRVLEAHPNVGETRGIGLMAAVELVESKLPKKRFDPAATVGARVLGEMANRAVITRIVGDVLLLAPPLVASDSQIDQIVKVIGDSIRAVCG
jgi:adenosylmethionine-8-amino-7-oxononanoate aminotransferase